MLARIKDLPLFVIIAGVGTAAMYVPAFFAWFTRDWASARAFGYSALLFTLFFFLLALATITRKPQPALVRSHLLAILIAYAVIPLMLALPVMEAVRGSSYQDAYYEMVSSLTTTGASFLSEAVYIPPAVDLWRALVGWLGGLFVWVTAVAIMAPINLGGFEVIGNAQIGRGVSQPSRMIRLADPSARLIR